MTAPTQTADLDAVLTTLIARTPRHVIMIRANEDRGYTASIDSHGEVWYGAGATPGGAVLDLNERASK